MAESGKHEAKLENQPKGTKLEYGVKAINKAGASAYGTNT